MLGLLRRHRLIIGRYVAAVMLCSWLALHCEHCLAALINEAAPESAVGAGIDGCEHGRGDRHGTQGTPDRPCDCGAQAVGITGVAGPDTACPVESAAVIRAEFAFIAEDGRFWTVRVPLPPTGYSPAPRDRYPLLLN